MWKLILLIPLIGLAGCATPPVGSVAGGECRLVHTPTYSVRGKTTYDQEWITDTTEALVRGCRQPRPAARPASLDMPVKVATQEVTITKKRWWQKLRKQQ